MSVCVFSGCATTTVNVEPGRNGIHKIIAYDFEVEKAEVAAVDAAIDFCRDRDRDAKMLDIVSLLSVEKAPDTDENLYKTGAKFKCVKMN